ncbi:tyrosine-type recombinase/integrase [Caballeronia sp. S22]|uniref:tyrosine-type recombinase/integrase n=1 Tax=Caballeronia sp. S22 TaxID=3137182 RepID=UPI0035316072
MGFLKGFKGLENLRYRVTYSHNVTQGGWQQGPEPSDANMNLTVKELIEHHKNRLFENIPASTPMPQALKNQLSTLHSFLAFQGKTVESWVGTEFSSAFQTQTELYLESIVVASRTKSDRRSHLKLWKRTAELLRLSKNPKTPTKAGSIPGDTEFHRALRQAIASRAESPTEIARKAGADVQAVRRWLKGAVPNRRAFPSLRRLERELGLDNDSLRNLVPNQRSVEISANVQSLPPAIAYRSRQRKRSEEAYRMKEPELSVSFSEQWRTFFDYKTTRFPKLKRSKKGVWRLLHKSKIAVKVSTFATKGEFGCTSADKILMEIRCYFGYLIRPSAEGGFGINVDEAQTLAWLAVPDAVNGYLEFLTQRSDGIIHGGHGSFCSLVKSLTHPQSGYLALQPSMQSTLPERFIEGDWSEACETSLKIAGEWKQQVGDKSRNPYEPIQPLLNLSEPLAPIIRAVRDLDRSAAAAPNGSVTEALHKRDALLLSMLMANPLRRRNYIQMTWNNSNTGNLYRREDGQWRLRFDRNDFKNVTRSRKTPYDAPLPTALCERIDSYVTEYRPRLVQENPENSQVFPSRFGEKWEGLSRHVEKLTKKLVPETLGFGTHAFRHLVATDYLRKNPGDYLTVALLLHDKLETVLAEYAHLRQDDSFGRYEQHLAAIQK